MKNNGKWGKPTEVVSIMQTCSDRPYARLLRDLAAVQDLDRWENEWVSGRVSEWMNEQVREWARKRECLGGVDPTMIWTCTDCLFPFSWNSREKCYSEIRSRNMRLTNGRTIYYLGWSLPKSHYRIIDVPILNEPNVPMETNRIPRIILRASDNNSWATGRLFRPYTWRSFSLRNKCAIRSLTRSYFTISQACLDAWEKCHFADFL